ncbi:hypothetical protein KFL_002230150 [Klebsormidium nitens]|uniref:Oxidation resistance protein 1 n=1 Tax=Klebsormidium nitens TaxID=105231 RepID=A0A1Y1I2Q1_KLENI|nr:hypothetical protein KFL_002230150 [Klebsormidium nitens]|eukprot:GAQ85194.1 hypothetical protein KFL_002230150 [Klebsormidium nitens]
MRVVLKKLGLKRGKKNETKESLEAQRLAGGPGNVEESQSGAIESDLKASSPAPEMEEPQATPPQGTVQNQYGEVFTDEFQGPDTSSLTAFLVSLLSYTPEPPERLRPSQPASPRSPETPQRRSSFKKTALEYGELSQGAGTTARTSAENQELYSRVHETAVRAHEAVARAEEAISTSRVRPDGPGAASQGGPSAMETTLLEEECPTPAARAHEAALRAKATAARAARSESPPEETDWQVVNEKDVPSGTGFWHPSEIGARSHHHMPGKIKTVAQLVIPSKVVPRSDIEPPKKSPLRKPPELSEPSVMLTEGTRSLLCTALPALAMGRQWVLLYSTERHGISLHTLYRNSTNDGGATLLVVQDSHGAIFGGFSSQPYNPSVRHKYQGGNDSFVFSEKNGEATLYRSTGENRYFLLCTNEGLAFGGGDHFALRIDEELLHGSSGPCATFGSPCLAHSEEFDIRYVEVWGFAHVRRLSTPI